MGFKVPHLTLAPALVATLAAGCAGAGNQFRMSRAEEVPAADAELEVREERNGNTQVALAVANLPPPARFRESATTYVVWAQEPGGGLAQNLGALGVGQNGRGMMESLTPMKKFDIYVTAEALPEAKAPSGNRALWASVAQETKTE